MKQGRLKKFFIIEFSDEELYYEIKKHLEYEGNLLGCDNNELILDSKIYPESAIYAYQVKIKENIEQVVGGVSFRNLEIQFNEVDIEAVRNRGFSRFL